MSPHKIYICAYAVIMLALLAGGPDYWLAISTENILIFAIIFALPILALGHKSKFNTNQIAPPASFKKSGIFFWCATMFVVGLIGLLDGTAMLGLMRGESPNNLNEVSTFVGMLRGLNVTFFISAIALYAAGALTERKVFFLTLIEVLCFAKAQFILLLLVALLCRRGVKPTGFGIIFISGALCLGVFILRNGDFDAAVRSITAYSTISAFKSVQLGVLDNIAMFSLDKMSIGLWLDQRDEILGSVPVASSIEVTGRFGFVGASLFWIGVRVLGILGSATLRIGSGMYHYADRIVQFIILYNVSTSMLLNTIFYPVFWIIPFFSILIVSSSYFAIIRGRRSHVEKKRN
jgi:hypothetical protein